MAEPEISETQFVFAFLRELYERRRAKHTVLPFGYDFYLPTTSEEKEVAADALIKHYSHSEYYQFKRSDRLKQRRGKQKSIPASYLPYYRFKIYNKETTHKKTKVTKKGQFEKLVELTSLTSTDKIYYCAPCFHTQEEFIKFFYTDEVVNNSILINCRQFNDSKFKPPNFDINDGDNHYLVFKLGESKGYACSEPTEILLESRESLEAIRTNEISPPFDAYVEKLYYVFYLDDELNNESFLIPNQKETSLDLLRQVRIVRNYLFAVYDIIWNPIFNRNG